MKSFNLVYKLLSALVLSASVTSTAVVGHLEERQGPTCAPYNISSYVLDFEDVRPHCFFTCALQNAYNLTSPRGAGFAYKHFGKMEKPLLLGNAYLWKGINCTWEGNADKDERFACGDSSNALYSPGKSPWDPKIKPRVGSLDFPDTYSMGAIDSLYITPLRLPAGTREASVELTGLGLGGKKVTYVATLDIASNKKRFFISGLKARGFTGIRALDLWVSAGNKGGYEFALDDLALEEWRPKDPSCRFEPKPVPTNIPGACNPRPRRTNRWQVNGEEFTQQSAVGPGLYKSVHWNNYVGVFNSSTLSEWQLAPAPIASRPGKNFFHTYSALSFNAHTYEQRFGVESMYIACNYPPWQEPDYSQTNGRPCKLTFIGRRDPFDGDKYPDIVVANFSIPNPVNQTSQRFTKIDLNQITDKPGKFRRLYKFIVIAIVGEFNTFQNFAFDNIEFSREVFSDHQKCRAGGYKELTFDDIDVDSTGISPVPPGYKDFQFHNSWAITSRSRYPEGSPGYIGAKSPPNALYSNPDLGPETYPWYSLESYTSPVKNFLFTVEEFSITFDLPDNDPTALNRTSIHISLIDACGYSSYSYAEPMTELIPSFYNREIKGLKSNTYTFAEPLAAISQILVSVFRKLNDEEFSETVRVDFWIDNFRYRKWEGKTPGCWRCGRRGEDWCEVPRANKMDYWL